MLDRSTLVFKYKYNIVDLCGFLDMIYLGISDECAYYFRRLVLENFQFYTLGTATVFGQRFNGGIISMGSFNTSIYQYPTIRHLYLY